MRFCFIWGFLWPTFANTATHSGKRGCTRKARWGWRDQQGKRRTGQDERTGERKESNKKNQSLRGRRKGREESGFFFFFSILKTAPSNGWRRDGMQRERSISRKEGECDGEMEGNRGCWGKQPEANSLQLFPLMDSLKLLSALAVCFLLARKPVCVCACVSAREQCESRRLTQRYTHGLDWASAWG